MNRFILPVMLVLTAIILLSVQCTCLWRWPVWDVRLELLPSLLLYAAFTLNLPAALLVGLFAAVMYDSFSGGSFAASTIPYVISISCFSALRPIFFRDRITTQLLSGFVFCWIALVLQWAFAGKFPVGWVNVLPKLTRLSVFGGVLAVFYFAILDAIFRLLGFEPGRFDDSPT
jgi:hypothetical protein